MAEPKQTKKKKTTTTTDHIVMLPFMAHGHLIPFLSLANLIHERSNHTVVVTIASTPHNIQFLKSTISEDAVVNTDDESDRRYRKLRFAELAFSSVDQSLPPDVENTEKLPPSEIPKLTVASPSLEGPLRRLISEIREEGDEVLCIVSDVFFGWVTEVAKSVGTRNVTFSTAGAYGILAYISVWCNLPHKKTDSEDFWVPGFPENYRFHCSQLHKFIREANESDAWSSFFRSQISLSVNSDGWICNTIEEIEPLGLQLLRNYIHRHPVWPIGPIFPLNNDYSNAKKSSITLERCIEWLDSKDLNSVLYISFGSQNSISESQMMALAMGIEESEKNFIWVIRPPLGFATVDDDEQQAFRLSESWFLPQGFEERTRKKGLLIRNWAPQLEILSHRSICAFLSHCGWNSVLESLSHGVPIIGWPIAAEQSYNSKMLMEEMGVSVEITRTVETTVSGKEVKKVIEMVTEQEEGKGKEMKKRAMEIAEVMRKAKEENGEKKDPQ
ncbi:UDP-glycosyltransferase 92A1-like [Prosopis cineraria]|uniref:UDP-glycosyltransferase 92A1-like n=1 Tax=Prosopis cineraria TaxID=364024 RepID=UPI002410958D|nr:UDP-glycosyltransferase 92A1-like [Prosopis cineraria]